MENISEKLNGNPENLIKIANQLLRNLQFNVIKANENGSSAFLGINVNVDSRKNVICGCCREN